MRGFERPSREEQCPMRKLRILRVQGLTPLGRRMLVGGENATAAMLTISRSVVLGVLYGPSVPQCLVVSRN